MANELFQLTDVLVRSKQKYLLNIPSIKYTITQSATTKIHRHHWR